ncbi:MAG: choline-sulfatase [Pseudomonadota bacterium]
MPSLPHIVIFQADQLAAPAMRLYGGFGQTPFIDSLAETSVVFDNAYCNYPLCAPSRFSMMTGQLPFAIGAYDNAAELPSTVPTFAHYLRRAGYRTCLSGKMHFIGADQLHGFEERLTTEIYPSGFSWLPNWESRQQNFEPIRITIERGGVCAWNMQLAFDEDVAFQTVRKIYEYAREPEQPFCLVVSLSHPHHPFLITPEYWERYASDAVPAPTVGRLPDAQLDPHSLRCRQLIGLDKSDVTDEQRRDARHAYFGAISYFDDKVAQVMNALEVAGMSDNTAVFVLADHGEMLGERGLWAKDSFFEWSVRIPFVARLPGQQSGSRFAGNVSLLDLMPTLLDLAGVASADVASALHGHSLLNVLQGESECWPDQAMAEYAAEAAHQPMVMLRRGRYKYIHAENDPPLLFDLQRDPDELTNLAVDKQFVDVLDSFSEEVKSRWDLPALDHSIRASQRQRAVVGEALKLGRQESWDYQPQPDYGDLYVRGTSGGAEIADRRVRVAAKGYTLPTDD